MRLDTHSQLLSKTMPTAFILRTLNYFDFDDPIHLFRNNQMFANLVFKETCMKYVYSMIPKTY